MALFEQQNPGSGGSDAAEVAGEAVETVTPDQQYGIGGQRLSGLVGPEGDSEPAQQRFGGVFGVEEHHFRTGTETPLRKHLQFEPVAVDAAIRIFELGFDRQLLILEPVRNPEFHRDVAPAANGDCDRLPPFQLQRRHLPAHPHIGFAAGIIKQHQRLADGFPGTENMLCS